MILHIILISHLSSKYLVQVPNSAFINLRLLEELHFGRNPISSLSRQDLKADFCLVNPSFFREDFVSLNELTTFSMDGCEVEDQLELGFNLFTANTNLQVKFFFVTTSKQSFAGFGVSLPFPLLSSRFLPFSPLSVD